MYKYIIWDFDGTLFDTYPAVARVLENVLKTYDITENIDEILFYLHQSLGTTFSHFSKKHSIDINQLRQKFVITEEAMDVTDSHPFSHSRVLLEKVVANGGINLIYTNRGNSIHNFLKHYDYSDYFTEIITREDGFGRKPKPDCILYFLDKYNLQKEQTLMVGDRELDVLAAVNAGIDSCYFNSHKIPIDTNADIYIENLADLSNHI